MLPRRSRQEMKIIPPSKGGAGGCPVVNVALEPRTSPPYAPLNKFNKGDSQRSHPCRGAAPPRMKMCIPLLRGVEGWVVPNRKDPPRKADAFCPSQGGIFKRVWRESPQELS